MGIPKIKGDKVCSAIPRETGDRGVTYDYVFPSYQTPGPEEGDIIIKKEIKGSLEIKSFDMTYTVYYCKNPKCDQYTVVFDDANNRKAKLSMSKYVKHEGVSVILEVGNRTSSLISFLELPY